jgi:hypothetical protein
MEIGLQECNKKHRWAGYVSFTLPFEHVDDHRKGDARIRQKFNKRDSNRKLEVTFYRIGMPSAACVLSQKYTAEIAIMEAEFPKPRQGRYRVATVQDRGMTYLDHPRVKPERRPHAEAPWSAVAAATAFRLRLIREWCECQNQKGGSCCYRTPRCPRQHCWVIQVSHSPR